jgi:hypothetical protein
MSSDIFFSFLLHLGLRAWTAASATMMFTTAVPALLLLGCLPGQARGSDGSSVLGFAHPHRTAARAAATTKAQISYSSCYHGSDCRSVRGQHDDGAASQAQRPSDRHLVVLYASDKMKDSESQVGKPTYKPADDGRSVGFVLLGISLLVSAWLFTIPPSFRRAYLCPSDYLANSNSGTAQQQEPATDCVPLKVWWSDVAAYYRGGGGIQWDFSIDPQTVQDNQEFLDAVITSYSNRIETQSK